MITRRAHESNTFDKSLRPASDRAVEASEAGTRDGLQIEEKILSPAQKIELVNAMIDAGLRTIEVTSFVSPKGYRSSPPPSR